MDWEPDSHEFTDGKGRSIGIEIDEHGVVQVFYYDFKTVVVSHELESWTDSDPQLRVYNCTVTTIRPEDALPSHPAPEAN